MKTITLLVSTALVGIVLFGIQTAWAEDVTWLRTAADGPSTWNDDANWMTAGGDNFVPDSAFEDSAVINNGGWAFLEEPALTNNEPLAGVDVGRDINAGTLEIRNDGALKTNSLNVAGAEPSTLILSGNANLEVSGDASTLRNTRIVGPGVTFSVTGDYTVGGTFHPVITADTHSAVQVDGAANIASAVLRPEFDGVTPAIGDNWPLIKAGSVAGNFQLDASLAPQLDTGLIYASAVNAGEGDVSLFVTNTLNLVVNRRNGQSSIRNVVGDAISLDSYSITSASGRLDPSSWMSFADSGSAGDGWAEGTVDAQILTESKSGGTSSIEVGSPIGIGAPIIPANFAAEDLEFTFSAGGLAIPGQVTYEGIPFNMVLNVDPATGSAEIINQATVDITFDGYSVASESGALRPEDGAWSSLQDSGGGGGGWQEANPTENFLNELNPEGTTTLAPNQSLSLGSLFDINGTQDIRFQYFLAGGSPDLREGFVAYGLASSLPGDCNGDGVIDIMDANCTSDDQLDAFLAGLNPPSLRGDADGDGQVQFSDFVILSENFATPGQYTDGDFDKDGDVQFSDFVILSERFGQSGGAVAATVPEPSTWTLLAISGLAACLAYRRRRSIEN